jgi:hypothetical protein
MTASTLDRWWQVEQLHDVGELIRLLDLDTETKERIKAH